MRPAPTTAVRVTGVQVAVACALASVRTSGQPPPEPSSCSETVPANWAVSVAWRLVVLVAWKRYQSTSDRSA